jgi:glucose-1-phosphate thymidylyltransferase
VKLQPIAVIPVAGVGSRLKPHTHTVPKALINVAGRPMLAHILDELLKIGVNEAVFVVGHMGDRIREYVESKYKIKAHYVEQLERKGLGHAVFLTRDIVGDRPTLIVLGDTIFRADFQGVLNAGVSTIGVKEVEDPRRFGVAEVQDGVITKLVEKPEHPVSRLAVVGIYFIAHGNTLFSALDTVINEKQQMTKGEFQLTDALELMIQRGEKLGVFPVDGWYDCGKTETLLATNRDLLDMEGKNPQIEGSVILGPVAIDPTAVIKNSIIGPYASIASGVIVRNAVVRNSILNEDSQVEEALIESSLIGENAVVRGSFKKINVGDSSEVHLA